MMYRQHLLIRLSLLGILFLTKPSSYAQEQTYHLINDSSTIIYGESNVSNWSIIPRTVNGIVIQNHKAEQVTLDSLYLNYTVTSLKSGRSSLMDNKAWKALKNETCSNIIFTSSSIDKVPDKATNIQVSGTLHVACQSKKINVPLKVVQAVPEKITLKGQYVLNMTDYGITPPSAMFGSLTCEDSVTIKFNLIFKK